ncbi:MAG: M28 family peptidase [Planctomycetales bacterium]|nr:M28 family peptidase [Planctomycetales bacterium]
MAKYINKPAILTALAVLAVVGVCIAQFGLNGHAEEREAPRRGTVPNAENPFDGARSYGYLKAICELGPRVSGSPGMSAQQEMLTQHFTKLGAKVTPQRFRYRHPQDGSAVEMANLIIEWNPEAKDRVLLCAHYDTRPYPDRDPQNPQGEFIGANDGGSGVALMMELGNLMSRLDPKLGVDFVLFDAEEFVFGPNDRYFLGSEYFARQYVAEPPAHKYRWAVLLDMVGDADLEIFQERNSLSWRESRPLIKEIWQTAARLGIDEFVDRPKYEIQDDHLRLYYTAKIPSVDVIDFDYPAWHTEADRPEACSAESLAKVGWVMHEWLKSTASQQ